MYKRLNVFFILIMALSCVEYYEFDMNGKDSGIVIESYISNKSFADTENYPADGRYFNVILRKTSKVKNIRDEYISNAQIRIQDNESNSWIYTSLPEQVGHYYLYDKHFKADYSKEYQMVIELENGIGFSSEWEKLPTESTEMRDVIISETGLQKYKYQGWDKNIVSVEGIDVSITLPLNETRQKIYYRWDFKPLWIFIAPYAYSDQPGYQCWVRSNSYMPNFELQADTKGDYQKKMFFIETRGNERVYEYFSVLITQQVLDKDYYNFWNDLKEQTQRGGGIFTEPPFSLKSNFTSSDPTVAVSGYFGVVTENAFRWELDKSKLSYFIENDLKEECDLNICFYGPCPPRSCLSCLSYFWGETTNQKPLWWD